MSLPQSILDLFFPRNCVWSGSPVDSKKYRWFSAEAEKELFFIREPYCQRCGFPFFHWTHMPKTCPLCSDWEPRFDACRSLLLYKGAAKALVQTLKYRNGSYLQVDLQTMLQQVEDLSEWFSDAILIPVPLYKTRERERGYNQSELLIRCIMKVFPKCKVEFFLQRVRSTPTQTHLNAEDRRKNVKGAFQVRGTVFPELKYVLVDDVMTTGATLDACAAALKKAGAKKVKAFTLAHG
jgi:ComF family protein